MDAMGTVLYRVTHTKKAVEVDDVTGRSIHADTMRAVPRPTDFLAYSRQYASDMGLDPDITVWDAPEFQSFLDWWLLLTASHMGNRESD